MVRQLQSAFVLPFPWQSLRPAETQRASDRLVRVVLAAGGVGALLAPATLALVPASQLFERAHFSLTSSLCLAVILLSWSRANGRTRTVRGWIALGAGVWTALHAVKNVEFASGTLPFQPEVLLLGVAVAAAGAYQADLGGRTAWREQLTVYLDAAVV